MKRFILIGFLIICCASPVLAYKTNTHELISAGGTRESSNYQKFISEFGINRSAAEGLVLYGSVHEDDESFFLRRYQYHFYDPINGKGLARFDPAPVWGYSHTFPSNDFSWAEARKALYNWFTGGTVESRKQSHDKLFRSLGQIVHLVQDMAQPSHTRNDPHSSHYESEAGAFLLNLSHLEDWAQFHQDQVSDFTNSATGPRPVDSFEDAFETLALFSNQNFFSDDTIFKGYLQPSKEETNYTDAFLPSGVGTAADVVAEDGHFYKVPYIIKTQGVYTGYKLAQVGYFGPVLVRSANVGNHLLAFQVDDEVARENAEILIPQAVGYSAGLLDYFFRGRIDMVKDPNTTGQYLIQNKTAEQMSGNFSLYYDDISNNRLVVASWSNVTVPPNGQSSSLTFKTPTSPQPKEKGKYILVFQGSMGNEEGTIVGTLVKVNRHPPLYVQFIIWDEPFTIPNRTVYWDIENDVEINLSNAELVSSVYNIRDINDLKERTYTTSSYLTLPCGPDRPDGELVWSGPNPGTIFLQGVAAPFGTYEVIWKQPCSGDVRTQVFSERWSDRIFGYSFARDNALGYLGINIPAFRSFSVTQDLRSNQITATAMSGGSSKFGIYLFSEGVLNRRIESEGFTFEMVRNLCFTCPTQIISESISGTSLGFEGGAVTLGTFDPHRNWAVTVYGEHNGSQAQRCGILFKGRPDVVHVRIDSFDYDGTQLEHVGNKNLQNLGGFWFSHIDQCPSLEGLVAGTVVE